MQRDMPEPPSLREVAAALADDGGSLRGWYRNMEIKDVKTSW